MIGDLDSMMPTTRELMQAIEILPPMEAVLLINMRVAIDLCER